MWLPSWLRPAPAIPPARKSSSLTLDQVVARYEDAQASSGVVTELSALRVSAAQACLALIANDVATMPLRVRRRIGDEIVDAPDARAFDLLLRRPNPLHSAFEFMQMMTAAAVLRGNAYAYIARDRGGRVARLWPLPSGSCHPQREGLSVFYDVNAYEGAIAGRFERRNILHLRNMMWDGVAGLDRLSLARGALGLSASTEKTQAALYRNGNRMPGYYTTDEGLGDEALDRIAKELMAATTGMNQGRAPVLDRGLEYRPVGQTMRDAEMIETRRHQIVEVCAAFNVVPAVLGVDDKTQAFASVEAMMRWHLQHTLRPWLKAWTQALDRDVLDGEAGPLFAEFDTAEVEMPSFSELSNSLSTLVAAGVLTRNDARRRMGLAPLPGLDAPLRPLNMGTGDET